jgi:protein gp37
MAEQSKIAWTTSTWNPWRGCTKVAEGCRNCYAEKLAERFPDTFGVWGDAGARVVASEKQWNEPKRWETRAANAKPGDAPWYVFCASLADVFEYWRGSLRHSAGVTMRLMHEPNGHPLKWGAGVVLDHPGTGRLLTMQDARQRVFDTWQATPHLRWLVLTKRPKNILPMLDGRKFPNVMFGTSAAIQDDVDRLLPYLIAVKRAGVCAGVFLSAEPQVERLTLDHDYDATSGLTRRWLGPGGLDWVIIGGESGQNARLFCVDWARDLIDECRAAGTACFFKQTGSVTMMSRDSIERRRAGNNPENEWPEGTSFTSRACDIGTEWQGHLVALRSTKGEDPAEWPEWLRVREFPTCFE